MRKNYFLITMLFCLSIEVAAQTKLPVWIHGMGLTAQDYISGIVTDSLGNTYSIGTFEDSMDFDPGPGSFRFFTGIRGSFQPLAVFVLKLDPDGNFIWVRKIGWNTITKGSAMCLGKNIALDHSGHLYCTGEFSDSMECGNSGLKLCHPGFPRSAFIVKMNTDGDFIWARCLNGNKDDRPEAIAADDDGVYTTGFYGSDSVDLDPGPGAFFIKRVNWSHNVFVNKLDTGGNFVWGAALSGTGYDFAYAIATDKYHHVFISGGFFNGDIDFDPGSAAHTLTAETGDMGSGYLVRLDALGKFEYVFTLDSAGISDIHIDGR